MDPKDQEPGRVLERRRRRARLTDAIAFQRRPLETLARCQRSRGELFAVRSIVGGRLLVVGTPDLAHEVLHAPAGTYLAGAANRRMLPVLPENTVLTLDGDAHLARRRLLAPLFHGDALEAMAPVIRDVASREIDRWPVGRPFAVLPQMRFLALCIAARLILGLEDHAQVRQLERHLARALSPYSMLAGIEALRLLGPASPQAAAERCRRAFARGLADVLDATRTASADRFSGALESLGADELFALLLAGHETTATALAWAIDQLARAPGVAKGLADEPRERSRPWLDAVIWETLRLRPPLIDIVRQTSGPTDLAGRDLPAGTLLLIPPPLIHRQAAQPDADRFEPERFRSRHPDPRTWLPFGGGARRCLGASLAMLELREIIPQIVERFELRPATQRPERPKLYGTALVPAGGTRVVLAAR
jgi:cytochrome P450 family 135